VSFEEKSPMGRVNVNLGKLLTKNKNSGAMWSKVDIFSLF
jgi:hypothetical protein